MSVTKLDSDRSEPFQTVSNSATPTNLPIKPAHQRVYSQTVLKEESKNNILADILPDEEVNH